MFKILDGRTHFYQWDLNRQLIINDSTIKEVHFCNRIDECSLVVEVKDGIANVPNSLLMQKFDIRVFAFDGEATKHEEVFKVIARTRPADYVYTEVELVRYEDLSERVNALEEGLGSTVAEEVNKYMEENPVNVDLTGYATEDYVDNAIANIDIPDTDLTNYYTKTEVDALIPEETDLSNYYTKEETTQAIQDAINAIPIYNGEVE